MAKDHFILYLTICHNTTRLSYNQARGSQTLRLRFIVCNETCHQQIQNSTVYNSNFINDYDG